MDPLSNRWPIIEITGGVRTAGANR